MSDQADVNPGGTTTEEDEVEVEDDDDEDEDGKLLTIFIVFFLLFQMIWLRNTKM